MAESEGNAGGVYPRLSGSIGFEGVSPPPPKAEGNQPMDSSESSYLVNNDKPSSSYKRYNSDGTAADAVELAIDEFDEGGKNRNDTPDRNTLTFRDGERIIDYVLAYSESSEADQNAKRDSFHKALKEEGLQLEIEDKKYSQDLETFFCKVHMPWKMCLEYAELFKIKMPIQKNDVDEPMTAQCCTPFAMCRPNVEEEEDYFTSPFYKDGTDLFIDYQGPDVPQPNFFTPAQRSRMVHEVLLRTRYGDEQQQFGIKRLVSQGVYTSFFPLHSGSYKFEKLGVDRIENKRQELFYEWARPGAFMKEQPYDAIREYFGEKVAIYFSWLGFYTLMLVPASIVGLIVFIYGLATMSTDPTSNEICGKDGDLIMCPQCDELCTYWRLNTSCLYSRVTYTVDNPATIFFTIFMALWATFFMEFWKRQQARIQYDWDVADYEEAEQSMRPEFQANAQNKKKNPITHDYEPYMTMWERGLRIMSSLMFIFFLLLVVLAAILAIIIYRIFVVVLIYNSPDQLIKSQASLITTVTAACLSVIVITLLNKVYEKIAVFLTDREMWKYQTEWEDSFTVKMYLFQFANYYGTIFYIAFIKGRMQGSPLHYTKLAGRRLEECDPSGCLTELAIQLAIVMVGKQALNNFKEIVIPILVKLFKSRKGRKKIETDDDKYTSWERDYDLVDFPVHGLYEEYLEMVIQYGFVTLFVAAFPLAPFFALLNNIIEVRLDATKMITQWKRPMADRAQDIGTWFVILQAISKMAVLINAGIIAFTSDFIQKSMYEYTDVKQDTGQSYIEWSLSTFRTSDFDNESMPIPAFENATFGDTIYANHVCRYRDFRNNPNSSTWDDSDPSTQYVLTKTYWHVLTARLAFILVFEHLVLGIAELINFLVPDVPIDVRDRTLREKFLAKVSLHERIKHQKESDRADVVGTTF